MLFLNIYCLKNKYQTTKSATEANYTEEKNTVKKTMQKRYS